MLNYINAKLNGENIKLPFEVKDLDILIDKKTKIEKNVSLCHMMLF